MTIHAAPTVSTPQSPHHPPTPRPPALVASLVAVFTIALPIGPTASAQLAPTAPTAPATLNAPSRAPSFDPAAIDPGWSFRIEPAVAFMAFDGDISFAGPAPSTPALEVETLNLDSAVIGPYGELHARKGRWSLTSRAVNISVEGDAAATSAGLLGGVAFVAGDTLSSSITYTNADVLAGYRFFSRLTGVDAFGREELRIALDAQVGVRLHDFELESRLPASLAAESAEGFFAEPVGGLAFDLSYRQTYGFDLYINGGGFDTGSRDSTSFDVGVSFAYQPRPWIGAQIGYRLLVIDLRDGQGAGAFEYDGSLAGLYWGLRLAF